MGRGGSLVGLVVLLMLALQLLAHGSLILASTHARSGQAALSLAQAGHAAEAAVLEALSVPPPPAALRTVPGGRVTFGAWERHGLTVASNWTRLSHELWLLEGAAGRPGRSGRVARALAVWIMDPVTRVAAFDGVVDIGPSALLDVSAGEAGWWAPLPEAGSACDFWSESLMEVMPPAGLPDVVRTDRISGASLGLGPLGWRSLEAQATHYAFGRGTPMPRDQYGECLAHAPWNFGDPTSESAPCSGHFALVFAHEDLELEGGLGQGLIAVPGDLTLQRGTRLEGVLLVGGILTLREGSDFRGLAVAAGGLHREAGSRIVGSSCTAVQSLSALRPRLGIPVVPTGSGWIGPLP